MTQVTGTITRPDGTPAVGATVTFTLAGSVRAFDSAADETIVAAQQAITVDELTGDYTIDLPGNASLNPSGTRWRRQVDGPRISPFRDDLIVPTSGGPYPEEDILAEPLEPLPSPDPTNIIDEAEITTPTAPLAVSAFTLIPIPLLAVTVPNVPYRTRVRVRAQVINTPSRSQASVGTTNASPNITGPADAFTPEDEGRTITGTGIPANTKIVAVTSETAAVMSNNATATGSITATIAGGAAVGGAAVALSPGNAIGQQKDVGYVHTVRATAGDAWSVSEWDVAPNTPGEYVASLYSFDTGTMVVQRGRMEVVRSPALASS